jgi:hypothetical protein
MRNFIFGGIGTFWGFAIILYAVLGGATNGGGAYQAGRIIGIGFGVLLLAAGPFYLIRGLKEWKEEKKERKKKPRRSRRDS